MTIKQAEISCPECDERMGVVFSQHDSHQGANRRRTVIEGGCVNMCPIQMDHGQYVAATEHQLMALSE